MFRKYFVLFLVMLLLTSCGKIDKKKISKEKQEKIKVAATIFPVYDILKIVGGDKIETILILPPGASPHTFEISPQQIKSMQDVKLFFVVGLGLDDWVKKINDNIKNTKLIELDKKVELRFFNEKEKKGDYDPHYWLNPKNAKKIAENMTQNLSEIDFENKNYYEKQLKYFFDMINNHEIEWKKKVSTLENKKILVFHDAWSYFTDYFGLEIVATFEPFAGKAPSPKYLIDLQKKVKEHNIKIFYVEPQLSQDFLKSLADDMNVQIKVLDPLGGVEGRESYIDLIDYNINIINGIY